LSFIAGETRLSPLAPGRSWNAELSALAGRMPGPGPFNASALSAAMVTWTTFGP
jgi:hypothetical protein